MSAVGRAIVLAIEDQLDDDERQLGLWSEPATEAGKKLTRRGSNGNRGRGRPPGVPNKRTEATVAALLQRYRDPRAVALERIQMHPADLAGLLQCSVHEAGQEQRLYMTAVFPFIHARITPEVIDNRQVIHLHLGGLDGAGAAVPGGGAIRVLDASEYTEAAEEPSAATDDKSEG